MPSKKCGFGWGTPPADCPKNKSGPHNCKKTVSFSSKEWEALVDKHEGRQSWINTDVRKKCRNHVCKCGAKHTQSGLY